VKSYLLLPPGLLKRRGPGWDETMGKIYQIKANNGYYGKVTRCTWLAERGKGKQKEGPLQGETWKAEPKPTLTCGLRRR